ncbi:MAG: radical SAM protein [Elusimicrobia bacterium]|nr:radical SAM protein [Elusimicrobiota bacterium]
MRCLELTVFHRCVNDCVFCSYSERMREFAGEFPSPEEVAAALARKRDEGFGHVTITGGEPTLYPRVWELLRRAKEMGYRTQVVSNGSALSVPGFAERTLPFVDELCLSVLGDRADVHDAMTRRPGSFERMSAALAAAAAHQGELRVTFNVATTRLNAAGLAGIAALAASHPKAREFWVSALIPEGAGLTRYSDLALPYARVMEPAFAAAGVARARGLEVRFFGFPACVLGERRDCASERFKMPSQALALRRVGGAAVLTELPPDEGPRRVKPPRCSGCALADECGGVWERHIEEFGAEEVSPCRN